jgi:hypothetical protein
VRGIAILDAQAILKGRLQKREYLVKPQNFPNQLDARGFDLTKIVHAFGRRKTVLFEFVITEALPKTYPSALPI